MKPLIVAGNIFSGKASSIADVLAHFLSRHAGLYNGVLPDDIHGFDLVIWAPEIPNEQPKNYPEKDTGTVLICSKVMRENTTEVDAVTRIFTMHGNAVICIYKDNPTRFRFKLIDALGNTWSDSHSVEVLALDIKEFYQWSKGQVRMSFVKFDAPHYHLTEDIKLPSKFIELNTRTADKVEANLGARYFGNFSTRCMKLFPSMRETEGYLFSPRNVDKHRIGQSDFVFIKPPYYVGNRKYSVDAPCQVQLYRQFDDINFMIHGHANITWSAGSESVPSTEKYYPCGDLREVEEIAFLFREGYRVINLKNHGFLLAASILKEMETVIDHLDFVPNNILRG